MANVEFIRKASGTPCRLAVLAGTFNPPTRAHVALLEAARPLVDEVLCVIPRVFPHKEYHGATLEQRLRMLELSTSASVAVADRGLFIDIARDCRREYGPGVDIAFVCGSDAARRIVEWEYGEVGAIERMLAEFRLLVAARQGEYRAPERLAHRIEAIEFGMEWNDVSATEIRERIRRGLPFDHLTPVAIVDMAAEIYGKEARPGGIDQAG